MAQDWFDVVGQPPAPTREDAKGPEAPDNDGRTTEKATGTAKSNAPFWATVTGALGMVVVAACSVAYLVNGSNSNIVDRDSVIGVAGECEPEDGEVHVTADDATIRGAVAQWQSSYYSRDVETLESAIAPGSWLRDNDWESVLTEAAPDGTTWCAVMSPTTNESVDVDVMVTLPDGESVTYPQTVSGVRNGDSWLIEDITTREE